MPVIDTHEHLPFSEAGRDQNTDVLKEYLFHYMNSDLKSAGLSPEEMAKVVGPGLPILERWRIAEPYWEACRYTGYGRALDLSVRAIYGIDGIHAQTIEALDAAFRRSLVPGHYGRVLKELCGIRLSILDGFTGRFECDRDFFRRVWQPQKYVLPLPGAGEVIHGLEHEYHLSIRILDDWMQAFSRELQDALANGIIALKCTLAYRRSLCFETVPYSVADAAFAGTISSWEKRGRRSDDAFSFPLEVQDFMMHYIMRAANEKHLVFQFHTGLQEGNGNTITNSDPSLLINLFLAYPHVDFDLFHISFPYQGIATVLAKNFPHVFLDMCWAHIISPAASRRALDEFLDAVPYTKISAFGGDYGFVDGIYGHLQLARENVSRVLARKISEGVFPFDKAVEIARALFHDNPRRLFRLESVLPTAASTCPKDLDR